MAHLSSNVCPLNCPTVVSRIELSKTKRSNSLSRWILGLNSFNWLTPHRSDILLEWIWFKKRILSSPFLLHCVAFEASQCGYRLHEFHTKVIYKGAFVNYLHIMWVCTVKNEQKWWKVLYKFLYTFHNSFYGTFHHFTFSFLFIFSPYKLT